MKKFFSFIGVLGILIGFAQFSWGQTTITTTTITANTTWNLAGSPYIVTGHVYVQGSPTPTLTIEPGVEVRLNDNIYLEIGHDSDNAKSGILMADGSSGTITFTRAGSNYWNNIDRLLRNAKSATTTYHI